MGILIGKLFARLLFWLYDFIDTLGAIFNILTGTQTADESRTLLEIFLDSAISTKVLLGLCMVSVVIAGASVGVKTVKNIIKFKAGGEPTSHATTLKQGVLGVGASVVCIFFVFMFIAFSSMLLNMVNDVIAPAENLTLSQNLFNLSVEQSYVIDESRWEEREVGDYLDESGHRVQEKDPTSDDGLAWEKDASGNYMFDDNGNKIQIWVKRVERYHPYVTVDGELLVVTGWVGNYTASDINWSMSPDQVFGVYNKDWIGLFEQADQGYSQQPMVRLDAFNLFTAYLVAVIMLISMFMLSVGLVKRIYDIIVLVICMPLVCGTIPLDDGARFRAWRETFMSKVLIAFGAVIALNVFFMIAGFIMGPAFDLTYLINEGVLSAFAVSVFKMLLLLGGALCMNSSQTLIARILGTSADEGREAMQSFALITSGVRMAAVGALGVGRVAAGMGRGLFGGTNRYGRERTGIFNYAARGANAIGERAGGEKYSGSRGAAFVRALGRMGGRMSPFGNNGARNTPSSNSSKQAGLNAPNVIKGVRGAAEKLSSVRPNSGLRTGGGSENKSGAFKDNSARRK